MERLYARTLAPQGLPAPGRTLFNLRLQRREDAEDLAWEGGEQVCFFFSIRRLHPCSRLSSFPQCTPSQVPPQLMPGRQRPPGDLPEPVRGPTPGMGTSEQAGPGSLPPCTRRRVAASWLPCPEWKSEVRRESAWLPASPPGA